MPTRRKTNTAVKKVEDKPYAKAVVTARTPNQKEYIKSIENYDLVCCKGPAGCGKTHIAVGIAVQHLIKEKVKRIVIARPVVEAGEQIGFLPGDIDSKMDPFVRPALDELNSFLSYEEIATLRNAGKIEIVPIGFMRGVTFKNSFILADEVQNLSFDQMKMLLTRLGEGSKMVLAGDTDQSDLPMDKRGAFRFTYQLFQQEEDIGSITLERQDIQRHDLVRKIVLHWENSVDKFRRDGTLE